jgi:hypothetical protein
MRPFAPILAALLAIPTSTLAAMDTGRPAPAFSSRDADGKAVSLASLRGKTVVLEWTNEGCPFVGHMYASGVMQRLQRQAAADGVVWLTVISSAPGKQGYKTAPEARAWKTRVGAAPADILLDPAGTLGRAYEAKTTPDMFVISPGGQLVYAGAIDDTVSTRPEDAKTARNYVAMALQALKTNRPISPDMTKSYGCSVKYQ